MNSILIPINDIPALRNAGIHYPNTEHSMRWIYRCRVERGLSEAFVRIGRRVLVDVPKFIALARAFSDGIPARPALKENKIQVTAHPKDRKFCHGCHQFMAVGDYCPENRLGFDKVLEKYFANECHKQRSGASEKSTDVQLVLCK